MDFSPQTKRDQLVKSRVFRLRYYCQHCGIRDGDPFTIYDETENGTGMLTAYAVIFDFCHLCQRCFEEQDHETVYDFQTGKPL